MEGAAREMRDAEGGRKRAKEETGVMAYHTSGPMSAQYVRDEIVLNLRVAIELQPMER